MYKKGEGRHYTNRRSRTASFKKAWFNVMLKGRRQNNRQSPPIATQRRSFLQRHLAPHRVRLNRQRRPSRRPSGLDRCLARWFTTVRRLSHFWATHVLLLLFLVAYTVSGAYIFVLLERETENMLLANGTITRIRVLQELWKGCKQAKDDGEQTWKKGFKTLVWGHRETLCAADAWTEKDPQDASSENAWTFSNSMLFCSTVFTTIGYGNVTPKTTGGQMFTIVYALVGIPYWLAVLADIGQVMRGILRRLYILSYKFYYLGRCFHWQFTPPAALINRFFASTPFFVTTDENGTFSPVDNGTQVASVSSMRVSGEGSLYILSGLHESDFVVPVWVGWVLLNMYVLAGAFLFTSYETWNFVESLYFIFVSLTTIGFGDFFPEKISLWIVFCYILVGLALVSLFFNLLIEYLQTIMKKAQRKITRAWAARISVVEDGGGQSPEGDLSPEYSGSLLNVHVVESLPFTLVTSHGFLRREADSLSRPSSFVGEERPSLTPGLPKRSSPQPIVLVQISDSRLLDYTRSEEPRHISDEEALVEAARDAVFGASRARSVLTPSSSSPPSSPPPRTSNHLHISEGSLLEYMQERMAFVHARQTASQPRPSQTLHSSSFRIGSTSPTGRRTSSNLGFMRRTSSQNMPSPRPSRGHPMQPHHQRRSSTSQEFQPASTSHAADSLPAFVPLRPLQEGVQLDQTDATGRGQEISVYSPLRRYVPSQTQPVRISTTKAASFADMPETTPPTPRSPGVISRLLMQARLSSSESDGSDDGSSTSASSRASSSRRIHGKQKKKGKGKHQTLTPHLQAYIPDSSPPTSPTPTQRPTITLRSPIVRSASPAQRPASTQQRSQNTSRSPQQPPSTAQSPVSARRASIGARNTPPAVSHPQFLRHAQQEPPESTTRRTRYRTPPLPNPPQFPSSPPPPPP